jgi:hypothetical protein
MVKTILFEILNLGYWDLFVIWCLGFGAYDLVCFHHIRPHDPCNVSSVDLHPHLI